MKVNDMEPNAHYEKYKNLTDTQLLDKYEEVAFKISGSKDQSMESAFELASLTRLTQERGLNMVAHLQKKGREENRQNAKRVLKDYRKEGWKMLILGAIIFTAGFALSAGTGALFYGALIIGGLMVLAGLFFLTSGFGMGIYAWWKFRK